MSLYNKDCSNTKSFNQHKDNIIENLKFKVEPIIYTGDEAFKYATNHIPEFKGKEKKDIQYGGYFDYQNTPVQFKNTGVICIFNNEVPTLAHELRHAKQYQDKSWWLVSKNKVKWLKTYYKYVYLFYPSEIDAYFYAVKYLFIKKEFKLCCKYSFKKTLFPYIAIFCVLLITLFFINLQK